MELEEIHFYLRGKLNSYSEHDTFINGVDREAEDIQDTIREVPELKDISSEINSFISTKKFQTRKLFELLKKAVDSTKPMYD